MTACETIHEKLVADEALTGAERDHLQACGGCQAFADSLADVAAAGAALADFGAAPAAEVEALRKRVEASLAPVPVSRRLAFALPALGLGMIGLVAMLALGSGPDAARSGAAVFSLMDEVDEITAEADEDAGIGLLTELFGDPADQAQDEQGWELTLPDAYQLLDDVLEERWL